MLLISTGASVKKISSILSSLSGLPARQMNIERKFVGSQANKGPSGRRGDKSAFQGICSILSEFYFSFYHY